MLARLSTVAKNNSEAPRSPRYVSIAADLRERIADGLAPHTLVPSERELSESYGVSRMTARHALSLLESEGLVYRRTPRGTFVAEPRVVFHIGSFSEEVARTGRTPAAQLNWAEEREPTPAVRAALGLGARERVNALNRLRLADEEAVALETTYFPEAVTRGLLQEPLNGSLWELLRVRYGVVPTSARATIESIVLDDSSCAQLQVRAASPGILLTRWTYDESGRCIEFARDVYRADRATFEVESRILR